MSNENHGNTYERDNDARVDNTHTKYGAWEPGSHLKPNDLMYRLPGERPQVDGV